MYITLKKNLLIFMNNQNYSYFIIKLSFYQNYQLSLWHMNYYNKYNPNKNDIYN